MKKFLRTSCAGLMAFALAFSVFGIEAANAQSLSRISYLRQAFGPSQSQNQESQSLLLGNRTSLSCRRIIYRPAHCDEQSPSATPIRNVFLAAIMYFFAYRPLTQG
ncbi:hypothetical protein [Acuticoccus kandeliae]|uniref:hypothetical protein n=1 Tax=Acuticoccus kandeliae TaxID=2073160 RepID=UPI000D3E6CD6|nr:hypothetical protein [Acuticoccus kandeliae]